MNSQKPNVGWGQKQHCNTVIIHEDAATQTRGRLVLESIFNEMGPDIPWRVSYLTVAQLEDMLVCEKASEIDVVIISVHNAVRSVSGGAWWLTDWLNADSLLPRALFLLHDDEEDSSVVRGLSALAESAGVTMLSRGRRDVSVFPSHPPAPAPAPAEQILGVS
ncbi:MAG: hypothetical protein HZC54_21285 [Verrucomicrobia bacterium]|nr:hypothetical protein [Verrucomicrobiota bacterium]